MASNIPRLAVTALAERLRVTGFTGADVWPDWIANDLDQLSGVAHREALALGTSYAIVWARPDGTPRVTVESARQVTVADRPRLPAHRGRVEALGDPDDDRGRALRGRQDHPLPLDQSRSDDDRLPRRRDDRQPARHGARSSASATGTGCSTTAHPRSTT